MIVILSCASPIVLFAVFAIVVYHKLRKLKQAAVAAELNIDSNTPFEVAEAEAHTATISNLHSASDNASDAYGAIVALQIALVSIKKYLLDASGGLSESVNAFERGTDKLTVLSQTTGDAIKSFSSDVAAAIANGVSESVGTANENEQALREKYSDAVNGYIAASQSMLTGFDRTSGGFRTEHDVFIQTSQALHKSINASAQSANELKNIAVALNSDGVKYLDKLQTTTDNLENKRREYEAQFAARTNPDIEGAFRKLEDEKRRAKSPEANAMAPRQSTDEFWKRLVRAVQNGAEKAAQTDVTALLRDLSESTKLNGVGLTNSETVKNLENKFEIGKTASGTGYTIANTEVLYESYLVGFSLGGKIYAIPTLKGSALSSQKWLSDWFDISGAIDPLRGFTIKKLAEVNISESGAVKCTAKGVIQANWAQPANQSNPNQTVKGRAKGDVRKK
jgi:hypothetical protein